METKNFNLSERKKGYVGFMEYFYREDVKEFIRRLKESIKPLKFFNARGEYVTYNLIEQIDNLAGEELK